MENNNAKNVIRGYKVFNSDWTCRDFQYEVGKIYEMDESIECCSRGFHFCLKAADCFDYYDFKPTNRVAEVIALGKVDFKKGDTKCCTNKLQIAREIPWDEVLRIVNTGDWNTGNRNTGDWNTGDWNTGNRNTGNWNTGNWNTGNRNTGDWNTGNRNTGDWNTSSFNTGCFMTKEPKISMFNKQSNWSYKEWLKSDARHLLNQIPKSVVEWIRSEDMTDEEKKEYPTHETTGGYLKVLDESECGQLWWDSLTNQQKDIIKAMPNFDAEIFRQCTGIKTEG